MRRWSEVAERVAATTRTSEKTTLLAEYLAGLSADELPIATVFLTGRAFAEADQRAAGLGWSAIQSHTDQMPTLAAMEGGPITTVVPSTTATALTSIATGLAPAQHGIVGYRMVVGGDVLNVLRWTVPGGGRGPDPFDVQRHTAFLGRAVPAITR